MNTPPLRDGKLIAAFVAALIAAAFAFTPLRADKPSSGSVTYSGRAIALKVDGIVNPTPGEIVIADTGALPATGGSLSASQSNVNLHDGAMTIDYASAEVSGSGPEASAESQLVNYHVHFITHDGQDVFISADYIGGAVSVSADKNGKISVDSHVSVQNLVVNGHAVTVTGAPNQVVVLDDAQCKLVINEQINSGSKGSGDVAISPIHFYICECIEGHMGMLSAGLTVSGTPPPPEDCGKITGGGWIVGTPSGDKGTFGVSGGIRRGEFWGHLTYIDHNTGMKVESTAVTGFQDDPASAKGRIITYAVTINGTPGTARVRAVDNGEPGRNDIFDLTLSTGYHAGGDLGGSRNGGGNIQLHKCPPGWQ